MEFRKEFDALGEVLVPAEHKWGAQTERSYQTLRLGKECPKKLFMQWQYLKNVPQKLILIWGK